MFDNSETSTKPVTVLITGVTGFIGSQLARRLIESGHYRVKGLTRRQASMPELQAMGVEPVLGDITDPVAVNRAVEGCDLVYHCAAFVGEEGNKEQVWEVNVQGTKNVVDAALAAKIARFVHVSSCAVYGSLQRFEIDESTPARIVGNVYSDSKVAAEEIVIRGYEDHNLPIVIARPSQVYGPGSNQFTIRPIQIIREGKMILIDGGRHFCKPVYIDNLLDGLVMCANRDAAIGEAINFTDGTTVTWRDFFGAYGKMLGVDKFRSVPYPIGWLCVFFNELDAHRKGKSQSSLTQPSTR